MSDLRLTKQKMIYRTVLLCGLFLISANLFCQNDFSIRWNIHDEGATVEDNPFNGSFIIKNEGETTLLIGDTIWYGYLMGDLIYDLNFNLSLYSGKVLDENFEPGDEFSVSNIFEWPLFWESGATVEFCATVYGEGIESYLEIPYTGDVNPTNNITCVNAILPTYSAEIPSVDLINRIYHTNDRLIVETNQKNSTTLVSIYTMSGQLLLTQSNDNLDGKVEVSTALFTSGLYIVTIEQNNQIDRAKILF